KAAEVSRVKAFNPVRTSTSHLLSRMLLLVSEAPQKILKEKYAECKKSRAKRSGNRYRITGTVVRGGKENAGESTGVSTHQRRSSVDGRTGGSGARVLPRDDGDRHAGDE